MRQTSTLFAFLPLAAAHFQMHWPVSRGFSEDTIVEYPCGGYDKVDSNRTTFPMSGGPIQLNMEHTATNVEVLIAIGNDPSGDDYTTVLIPTFFERGPNSFCMGDVTFPSSLKLKAGMNATIQVQTNGDPSGGLYACADITFGSSALSSAEYKEHCVNSTGVRAQALNTKANANETEAGRGGSSSGGSSTSAAASGSATEQAASATSSAMAARVTQLGALAVGAVGIVGMLALY